jgi:hypothetical protein
LVAAVVARKRDRADHAVAIDDGRPHLETEASVRLRLRGIERIAQSAVGRQVPAITPSIVVGARCANAYAENTKQRDVSSGYGVSSHVGLRFAARGSAADGAFHHSPRISTGWQRRH